MNKGLFQIYTGDGKGKSTALFGLAIRALGRGKKVLIYQFLKSRQTGELLFLEKMNDSNLKIKRANTSKKFSWKMDLEEKKVQCEEVLAALEDILAIQHEFDLILCDELINCVKTGAVTEEELISFVGKKDKDVEVVMTGRNAGTKLIERADLVTEMKKIKHPYDKGVPSREGIEF